jgi:hypothetical protein
MLGSSHCGPDDEAIVERASAESKPAAAAPAQPQAAPRPIAAPNLRAPASSSRPTADAEAEWIGAGSGFSNNHNAKGEPYTLSTENRYSLEGDRVHLEITYIGDDDVHIDNAGDQLALDGLEVVDGASEWALEIPAGETRVVTTTLRPSREGVVRLRATMASEGGSSSRRFAWVHEHGVLRRCGERECEAPIGEEQLSGERITVHVHNKCEVEKEFVLFAGYPELLPDESVTIYSLQPDERRTMQIDASQWFLNRHPDGHISGGVHTDEDGAHVTFTGSGETCSSMSTRSPNLPADGGPPPNPSSPK